MDEAQQKGRNKLKQSKSMLVLMLILAVVGLVMDFTKHANEPELWLSLGVLNGVLILGYALSALFFLKKPVLLAGLSLFLFAAVQFLRLLGDPENYGGNLFWKALGLIVLITVFANARQGKRLLNEK